MAQLRNRFSQASGAAGLVGFAALGIISAMPDRAGAVCSVFDRHPCAPTTCSVFRRGPCIPEIEYPIGQDLRLTIVSASADGTVAPTQANAAPSPDREQSDANQHHPDQHDNDQHDNDAARKLDSIKDLFAALRACWVPPAVDDARPGMQMSVRLSFKRTGEIIGTPRVTYMTPEAPNEVRDRYHTAITQALQRCTPMPFTPGMGGAVAGRPIAIRFVDNRKKP